MKKLFTLIAVAITALTASAQTVLYSWESPEGTVAETGGTIAFVNGDPSAANRLNYANSTYYTVCLNGKKANLADETASANAGHMVITLNEGLKEGDKITFTAYRNKTDADPAASIYMLMEKGTEFAGVEGSTYWSNIATGATPNSYTWTVPAAEEGSKTITMTRNDAGTNIFITKIEITRESTKKFSIDDICGNYTSSYSYGVSSYDGGKMYTGYKQSGIIISKIDADSVKITNLGGGSYSSKGKFDADAQTITLKGTYYKFETETVPSTLESTDPAVAVINADGTISLNYIRLYDSGNYGFKEVLTKSNQTLLWTVEGNIDYLGSDGATKWDGHSYKGTLKKYQGGDFEYEVTYGDPDYGYANPATMQFNVNSDGSLSIVNGTAYNGCRYFYYPSRDIYDVSFYNNGYSAFDKGPSQEAGEFYFWYYAYGYDNNYAQINSGYFNFAWPYTETGIKTVSADAATSSVRKYIENGNVVISKNGNKFTVAGSLLK